VYSKGSEANKDQVTGSSKDKTPDPVKLSKSDNPGGFLLCNSQCDTDKNVT
jgi:hypothetical protein